MNARHLLAGTFAAACAVLPTLASSQNSVLSPPVPTPAPNGTPVTFGSPALIGKPPARDAAPDTTAVPTGAPDGHHAQTAGERYEGFVVGDYLIQPKVYDELSHGNQSTQAEAAVRVGAEFPLGSLPFMFEAEDRRYSYEHEAGFITNPGKGSQTFEPGFTVLAIDADARVGLKILEPRLYLVVGYLVRSNNLPNNAVLRGPGLGIEKLPDFHAPLGIYGSALYYPNVVGSSNANIDGTPNNQTERYRIWQLQLGVTIAPGSGPIFLDIGVLGDHTVGRDGAPSNSSRFAPHVGVGFSLR